MVRTVLVAIAALVFVIALAAQPFAQTSRPMTTIIRPEVHRHQGRHRRAPRRARPVEVHYTGWLNENGSNGTKFDQPVDRGQPFEFPLGARPRHQGLGRRRRRHESRRQTQAHHSAELGYGAHGAGGVIPANAN